MEALKSELNVTEVLSLIKKCFKSWKSVGEEMISFQRLSGITNRTYRVETNQLNLAAEEKAEPSTLFVKVFDKDGVYFDRSKEVGLLQEIFKSGLGPELYAYEGKYRLEEFYQNSRTLRTTEMNVPLFRRRVANTLARFHSISPPDVEKAPLIEKMYEGGAILSAFTEKVNKEKELGTLTEDELDMLSDIEVLCSEEEQKFLLAISPPKEKLVFSHNDLLPGNVLILNEKDTVFIDYEYSSYNFRGYDIANYLNEAIIDYNIDETPFFEIREDLALAQSDIEDMIFHYVIFARAKELGLDEATTQEILENEIDENLREELENNELVQQECKDMMEEIKACTLMSHVYWIIWAVNMSKNPDIDFDYIKFAHERYQLYDKLKKAWYSEYSAMN